MTRRLGPDTHAEQPTPQWRTVSTILKYSNISSFFFFAISVTTFQRQMLCLLDLTAGVTAYFADLYFTHKTGLA